MISASGIGSGLDVNSIIGQLMAIERQPLNRLEAKKAGYEAQLSGYGKLQSALSSFQSAMAALDSVSDFKLFSATSSDTDYFTAAASSTASLGKYDIKVNTLAEAHKMGSASQADKDTTTFGNSGDTLTVTVDSSSFTVTTGGKTLEQIRDAINDATDNVGVTATIISESSSSYRLVLTSDNSGTANAMTLAVKDSGGSPVTDPLTMATINTAVDSEILVDGTYTVTRSSNTITDAIDGITLNLAQTSASTFGLTVAHDDEGVKTAVQSFVDAYNELHNTIDELRKGELKADNTLLSIERQIRDVLNTAPSGITGQYSYLAELGVAIQKDGTMSLDSTALQTALDTDFSGVSELFANDDQGYAYRLEALADDFLQLGGNGLVESRTDGINDRIESIENRIDTMGRRLVIVEQRYRSQFSALDSLLGQLTATSNYLTQQLSILPGATNSR